MATETESRYRAFVGRDERPIELVPLSFALGTVAKQVCSAVFLTGLDARTALRRSGYQALAFHRIAAVLADEVTLEVDGRRGEVAVHVEIGPVAARRIVERYRDQYPSLPGDWAGEEKRLRDRGVETRRAVFMGDHGCAILPLTGVGVGSQKDAIVPLRAPLSALPNGPGRDDAMAASTHPDTFDQRVCAAVDRAFARPAARTSACVVLHHGEVVGERYVDAVGPQTVLESWSMGKSLAATLAGVLVGQGVLDLDEPVPVSRWGGMQDPRGRIKVRDVLRMSSGLECSGLDDPREQWRYGISDHALPYCEAMDSVAFAEDRPLRAEPGSKGRYRNCDTLVVGAVVRSCVEDRLGRPFGEWWRQTVRQDLGAASLVIDEDWYGNLLVNGFVHGTARQWATLGNEYLRALAGEEAGGLTKEWATFVRTPGAGLNGRPYGGHFWLNAAREYPIPEDAFWMGGFGMQRVFIVPSLDLVVVRMGWPTDLEEARLATNEMLAGVCDAVTR